MSQRSEIVVLAIAACLTASMGLSTRIEAQEPELSPLAERIVPRLFREGLISSYFDPNLRQIAAHYTQRSRYAGNVRINEAPDPKALNLYVFHYVEGLPTFLRNNCNSLPQDHIILCDHQLLDSIPAPLPISIFKDGVVPPAFLMFWVIGHEIGHVVLGHDRSAFLSFGEGEAPAPAGGEAPSAVADEELSRINPFEVAADRFAISSLPVAEGQWANYGPQLLDAIDWELPRAGAKMEGFPVTPASEPTAEPAAPETLVVKVREGYHPPMVLRLYDLLSTIRSTFVDFPFDNDFFVPRIKFVLQTVPALDDPSVDDLKEGLFYGGFYVGSDLDEDARAHALLDRAIYMKLLGQEPFAGDLLKAACGRRAASSEIWRWQYALACGAGPQPSGGTLLKLLETCDKADNDTFSRCYALIQLLGIRCAPSLADAGGPPLYCPPEARLREIDSRYVDHPFSVPASLIGWMLVSRYLFQRDVLKSPPEILDPWIIATAEERVNHYDRSGWALLDLHSRYMEAQTREQSWLRLYILEYARSELAELEDNDAWAVEHRRRVIELLETHAPLEHAARGFHLQALGERLRKYNIHVIGSSDPLSFRFWKDPKALATEEAERRHAEAGPVSEAAAAEYFMALQAAREAHDTETIEPLHESYLNALGAVVFSYNISQEQEKALDAARCLLVEIDKAEALRKREEFGINVLAPALENAAYALLTSPHGDLALAAQYAQQAFDIRTAAGEEDTMTALSTLAFALYGAGDERAGEEALHYMLSFQSIYRRHIPLDMGFIVAGKFVSVQDLVADRHLQTAPQKQ